MATARRKNKGYDPEYFSKIGDSIVEAFTNTNYKGTRRDGSLKNKPDPKSLGGDESDETSMDDLSKSILLGDTAMAETVSSIGDSIANAGDKVSDTLGRWLGGNDAGDAGEREYGEDLVALSEDDIKALSGPTTGSGKAKSFEEMIDGQGGPVKPQDTSTVESISGVDLTGDGDFGSGEISFELRDQSKKNSEAFGLPTQGSTSTTQNNVSGGGSPLLNDKPADPDKHWRWGPSLMQKSKRAIPQSTAHKMGVAIRRARRMGINPNNMRAIGMLMDGRENDGGIGSYKARIATSDRMNDELDRENTEGIRRPAGGGSGLIPTTKPREVRRMPYHRDSGTDGIYSHKKSGGDRYSGKYNPYRS